MKDLLKKLSEAHGISGYEGNVREIIKGEIEKEMDEICTDVMGNFIAKRNGKSPTIMIAAHMDEVGLMAKYIDDDGFIRFIKIGSLFDQSLLNQRVVLHTSKGAVIGVIGSKPPHVMDEDERKKVVKAEDMFIDVGAKSEENAEKMGMFPGTPITIDRRFAILGSDMVTCKSFDDRAGIAMAIKALKRTNTDLAICFVATVQEEVGLKGAKTSAFGIAPDVALVAETCIPGDHPGIEKKESAIQVGKGPSITVADASGRGLIANERILKWLINSAVAHDIPYQLDVASGGTTDASVIALARTGIPCGVVSVPVRYLHSPVEVLKIKDLEMSATLIARALERAGEYF